MTTHFPASPFKGLLATWLMAVLTMLTVVATSALGSRFTPGTYQRGSLQLTCAPAPATPAVIGSARQTHFTEVAQNSTPRPAPHSAKPVVQTSTKKKVLNPRTVPCTPQFGCAQQ